MCDTCFCTIRLFLFASMAAATLHMLGQIHAEEPQNTVTRILEVWKKREASHTSFAFTWEVKGVFPRGTLPLFGNSKGETAVPQQDITVKKKEYLAVIDDKMRFTSEGLHWVADFGKFLSLKYVSVYDGHHSKSFYQYAEEYPYPLGYVNPPGKGNIDASSGIVRPVLLCYRIHHQKLGEENLSAILLQKDKAVEDGNECLILETWISGGKDFKHIYWVDPQRDYIIVRHILANRSDIPIRQIRIRYQKNPRWGYVPVSWELGLYNNRKDPNRLTEHWSAKVLQYDFNIPFEEDHFRLTFPTGTVVLDHEEDRKLYIIQPDGSRKYINSLDDLKNQQAISPGERSILNWRFLGLGLVVLMVASILGGRWLLSKVRQRKAML